MNRQQGLHCFNCKNDYNLNDRKPVQLICGDTLCERCYDANLIEGGKRIKCPKEGEVAFAFKMYNEEILKKMGVPQSQSQGDNFRQKPDEEQVPRNNNNNFNSYDQYLNIICSTHKNQRALVFSHEQKRFICQVCQSLIAQSATTDDGSGKYAQPMFKTFLPDQLKNISLQMIGTIDQVLTNLNQARSNIYNLANTGMEISNGQLTQDFMLVLPIIEATNFNKELIKQVGITISNEEEEQKMKEELEKVRSEMQEGMDVLQQQNDQQELFITRYQADIKKLQQDNYQLAQQNQQMNAYIEDQNNRIQIMRGQAQGNSQVYEDLNKANQQVFFYQSEMERLKQLLAISESNVQTLTSQKSYQENQIAQLKESVSRAELCGNPAITQNLNNQIAQYQSQINILQQDQSTKDAIIAELQQEVTHKQDHIDHLKNKCQELQDQLKEINDKYATLAAEKANDEFELDQYRSGKRDPYETFR